MFLRRKTPKINDGFRSIACLEKLFIGGTEQWLLMRGKSDLLPVLLFLHGGPGSAQIGFAPYFQRELERHFVVVNWDQRGAGLSYRSDLNPETMNIEQFIADACEVTNYLQNRFRQNKIFIVGHSWGSIMGVLLAERFPEYYHAYIGIGQVVNMAKGERLSLQYVMRKSQEAGHKKALRELAALEENSYLDYRKLAIQRKWLSAFKGVMYRQSMMNVIVPKMLRSSEYHVLDILRFIRGARFSIRHMWTEVCDINLEGITKLQIPVFLCMGKHDYNTPFELAELFFNKLEAPIKTWEWFGNSAHCPNFEEPEKFNRHLIHLLYKVMERLSPSFTEEQQSKS
ncbi:alpha/beta fold hydrolase [Paenibacillus sp. HJL G12]|uniref:Alpha/beta fold hydrolase n=1 Tax=Paenibacillus dendrobii TaxID=2691084 RepID=A0A7X3LFE8_9BACL|nr:alpha/beta hydrolase [Paenibacillus dendrobii]MWV43566.1 alpha/beta fold hydrolase [Paenibacillus dendrobii]